MVEDGFAASLGSLRSLVDVLAHAHLFGNREARGQKSARKSGRRLLSEAAQRYDLLERSRGKAEVEAVDPQIERSLTASSSNCFV